MMRLQGEGDSDNVSADSFETLAICGNGAYGRVLMVRSKADSRIYAMKCVDKTNVVQKVRASRGSDAPRTRRTARAGSACSAAHARAPLNLPRRATTRSRRPSPRTSCSR